MILRVRDKDGNILEIPAIKGDKPTKGIDYFTEEDKNEMRDEVFAIMPAQNMIATLYDGSTVIYRIYGPES